MPSIEIRKVQSGKDLKKFINFPWTIYRGRVGSGGPYPNWAPPLELELRHALDRKRNSWFLQGEEDDFLALRKGRVVGRISAHLDHGYVNFQNDNAGFFGFFESIDDPEVASALLGTVEEWARAKGLKALMGPVDQSTNRSVGCLVDGFDTASVVSTNWNPPYYRNLIEGRGYEKSRDFVSYRVDSHQVLSDKIARVAAVARKREGVVIRNIDLRREYGTLTEVIRDIYNDAWAEHWGFVPWTRAQFDQLGKDIRPIVDPDMVLIAEIEGFPVAFAFPMPDINEILIRLKGRLFPVAYLRLLTGLRKITTIRVAAFGVRRLYRNRGIDALFVHELYRRGLDHGYNVAEFSSIQEEDKDLRPLLDRWGARAYKTHRIFRKELV